jgi:hypothetical protein
VKKLWFKRKRYGFGCYPASWEGWVVIIVWAGFFTSFVVKMDHEWLENNILIAISIIILIWICYKKGELGGWGPKRKDGASEGE